VQAQLLHHLAGVEFEIVCDPIALARRRIIGCERRGDERRGENDARGEQARCGHAGLPIVDLLPL